jgi:sugar phosphate isomerase/epimerase
MDEALEFAEALGATHSTITPPVIIGEYDSARYIELLDRYVAVLTDVVAAAERRGVVMAIEPEPPMMLNGGKFRDPIVDIHQVLQSIKSRNLCILFDVCHANILSNGDPSDFLKKLDHRVSWVHVADNDGALTPAVRTATHLQFGEGNIEMERLMRTLKEEVPGLKWLQIDTWENARPYATAKKNKEDLMTVLDRIQWQ